MTNKNACELFNSPINQERARDGIKKRLRKELGAKIANAMEIAKKAVLSPELLTEYERQFHEKVMNSGEWKHDNA